MEIIDLMEQLSDPTSDDINVINTETGETFTITGVKDDLEGGTAWITVVPAL